VVFYVFGTYWKTWVVFFCLSLWKLLLCPVSIIMIQMYIVNTASFLILVIFLILYLFLLVSSM